MASVVDNPHCGVGLGALDHIAMPVDAEVACCASLARIGQEQPAYAVGFTWKLNKKD